MDALTAAGILFFISAGVALWATRNTLKTSARLVLVGSMLIVLGITIGRIEFDKRDKENVWHAEAPNWTQLPLPVYWDRHEYQSYNDTIEAAINLWNSRIGCTVLYPVTTKDDAAIVLHQMDGTQCGRETVAATWIQENPNAPASAWFCNGFVDVQTRRLDAIGLALRIVLHELGHGIGLAHDEEGAMAETVMEPAVSDAPEYLLPSIKDTQSIRSRYCP